MNAAFAPTPEESATLAELRARLDVARRRINAALSAPAIGEPRDALRAEVEAVRATLAQLEREHTATLARIRGEAEAARR